MLHGQTKISVFTKGSRCKIADFGLTRHYDRGTNGFKPRGKMTIPQLYCPPETFPPVVKYGVNKKAAGTDVPIYSEASDMCRPPPPPMHPSRHLSL